MDDWKQFSLRLPAGLYEQLQAAADLDERSLNNWVTRAIRYALAHEPAELTQ